ncbi:MAG: UDP-galactopyranose mutase, partial [Verrucomicrobiota bacterium]
VYTGPIDEFYGYSCGRLSYRTVFFKRECTTGDYLGNAVINYTSRDVPHTRIHEHKHFTPWESHEKSLVLFEYSKETNPEDVPYYPVRKPVDKAILDRYLEMAKLETNVSFLGRLATYRYLDMHLVIEEAMNFSKAWFEAEKHESRPPILPKI